MRSLLLTLTAALSTLALAGGAGPRPTTAPVTNTAPTTMYVCDNGTTPLVEFLPGRALITSDGVTTELPAAVAASGARYADAEMSLHTKGQDALWTQGADGSTVINCTAAKSSDAALSPTVPPVSFTCPGGQQLQAVVYPSAVAVTLNGQTRLLPQQRAASGIWFRDSRWDLRGKGMNADLRTASGAALALGCVAR